MDETAKNNRAEIQTFTGRLINLLDLKPKDVDINDIARGLASRARFAGQTKEPYSVARHSIEVSTRLRLSGNSFRVQLLGLLHDAHEAFMVDMPSPLKNHFPDYKRLEDKVQLVIEKSFGLYPRTIQEDYEIKFADIAEMEREAGIVRTFLCPSYSFYRDLSDYLLLFETLWKGINNAPGSHLTLGPSVN